MAEHTTVIEINKRDFMEASATFNDIIETVENRCMVSDGPVTPTLREMREDELSKLWYAVQTMRTAIFLNVR